MYASLGRTSHALFCALALASGASCSASLQTDPKPNTDARKDSSAEEDAVINKPSAGGLMNSQMQMMPTQDAGSEMDAQRMPMQDAGSAMVVGPLFESEFRAESALFGFQDGYLFVFDQIPVRHQLVTVTDFSDWCGNGDVFGRILYFDLFQGLPSGSDAAISDASTFAEAIVDRPATFTVVSPGAASSSTAPSRDIAIVSHAQEGSSGGRIDWAHGEVTVTAVSATEISADFDLTFAPPDSSDEWHVTGSFQALYCEDWARGSSVP